METQKPKQIDDGCPFRELHLGGGNSKRRYRICTNKFNTSKDIRINNKMHRLCNYIIKNCRFFRQSTIAKHMPQIIKSHGKAERQG